MTRETLLADAAHLISQRPDCAALPETAAYLETQIAATTERAASLTQRLDLDDDGTVRLVTLEGDEEVDSESMGHVEDRARQRVAKRCPELLEELYLREEEWAISGEALREEMELREAEYRSSRGV